MRAGQAWTWSDGDAVAGFDGPIRCTDPSSPWAPPLTLGWWRTSGKFGTYPVAGYAVPMNATTAVEAADEFAALWERAWVRAPSARATQRQ